MDPIQRETAASVLRELQVRLEDNAKLTAKWLAEPGGGGTRRMTPHHSILIGNDEARALIASASDNRIAFDHCAHVLGLRSQELEAVAQEEPTLSKRSRYLISGSQITMGFVTTAFTKASIDGGLLADADAVPASDEEASVTRVWMAEAVRLADTVRECRKRIRELEERNMLSEEEASRVKEESTRCGHPWFGCFTGDCPHETQADCDAAIRVEFAKLEHLVDCDSRSTSGVKCPLCNQPMQEGFKGIWHCMDDDCSQDPMTLKELRLVDAPAQEK